MLKVKRDEVISEAKKLEGQLIQFLLDLIALPAQSGQEEHVVKRVQKEMEKAGFDHIQIDKMGNIIGQIGSGKTKLLMDAHLDTVGTGDIKEWKHNPYKGRVENGIIYGRGASDQLAGIVSLVYAVQLIKIFGLEDDYTLYVTGTCHEEDCEGLPLFHIIRDEKLIKPDFVVLTEPTNLRISRGQPGRMELKITTSGKTCHSSRPDDGVNAIYKMLPIIKGIEDLNNKLICDDFLGKGTIAVTYIDCQSPALCAVPNECTIYVDRRLTSGETKEIALKQLQAIASSSPLSMDATIEILKYQATSWASMPLEMEKYFPGWVIEEDHILTRAAVMTAESVLKKKPEVSKWAFSTNGIATMGTLGIPTIGFGPANDIYAHTVEDQVPIEHLYLAASFYALFPKMLVGLVKQN